MSKEVRVTVDADAITSRVEAEPHTFIVDEPREVGGNDEGPDPYDYLLGALGACTAITLRLYARRKQWQLGKIEVWLQHERVYADDCQHCEQSDAKVDQIHRQIRLHGDLTDEQRSRLKIIAKKCPVHKTLSSGVTITTEIVA